MLGCFLSATIKVANGASGQICVWDEQDEMFVLKSCWLFVIYWYSIPNISGKLQKKQTGNKKCTKPERKTRENINYRGNERQYSVFEIWEKLYIEEVM